MIDQKKLTARLRQFQQKMTEATIEAFLLTNAANVGYFTNFTGSNGQLLITPKKAYFITDFRYKGLAKNILPSSISLKIADHGLFKTLEALSENLRIDTLTFEPNDLSYGHYEVFKKKLPKLKLKAASRNIAMDIRMIKDEQEIAYLRKAQTIAEKVFHEVKKNLRIGKTEREIAWEIEKNGHENGADTISFAPIVGFGSNSAIPHHQNSERKLQKGDVVLIDMGMKYQGYCSDMTRMIFTKKPTAEQQKIYDLVLEAQTKSIEALKAGVKGSDIDEIARSIIRKAGYGKTFGHSLGHGIGLEVHEAPSLAQGYEKTIPEGTIVTVEPGVYLENNFGVRIEDMLLVKSHKAMNFTRLSKKIEDCIIRL